jgi:hypothetical protein
MESANELKITDRQQRLEHWLHAEAGYPGAALQALPGDASFRRYFRVTTAMATYIAMDAPPAQESCHSFVAVANALRGLSLDAPEIIAGDPALGFLLLTDYGDATYLKTLDAQNADRLYYRALEALATLQSCREVNGLTIPPFTHAFMLQEWAWHKEWFLGKLLGLPMTDQEQLLDQCFARIAAAAAAQPQVFMHRDYHSANLMVLPEGVGILDFQDAFIGPVTYDLVSLLRDCYIDWPDEQVQRWVRAYLTMLNARGELLEVDEATFLRWFDWMGLERHLKALFTFARKHVRDQQPRYLNHIPRTLNYVLAVSGRYPELAPLHDYMQAIVQPAVTRVLACAR